MVLFAAAAALWVIAMTGCAAKNVVPAAGGTVPVAAPCNLWTFLLPPAQMKQDLCACICASPLGRIANNMLKPVSLFSGGLVPEICPDPNAPKPGDLAKPADSAEGAAARIKQSEAEAKARRAAVQYLATVDCKRYPEAEEALIAALVSDTSECVRLEAALALGNGCCCTEATMKALMGSVSGTSENDPPEGSMRVRAAAATALERCLLRCDDGLFSAPRRPESPLPPETPLPGHTSPAEVIPTPSPMPSAESHTRTDSLVEQARRVLAEYRAGLTPLSVAARPSPTGPADSHPRLPSTVVDHEGVWAAQPSLREADLLSDPPLPSSIFRTEPADRPAEVLEMRRASDGRNRPLR